ncbi:MAG: tRNA pseudouridine(38-40) synthase TruA [Phycisphaerales bacterium]|nr:tRNA pseudouridine(38-40) synthase TruA [Hyphomonadaceae bacterium]
MRFKLTIEYDGGPFQGWQRLAEGQSVQGAIEDAVEKLTGVRSEVIGSGRTDSGVHAYGQVAHADIEKPFAADRLRDALNAHLRPHPISVLKAEVAAPDFHARFDAKRRAYVYNVLCRRAPLTVQRGFTWRVPRALDIDAMNQAAQRLIGNHDFTTFRYVHCQAKSPVKTLDVASVRGAEDWASFSFEARSFLHRQVRSMVGTLVEVGLGELTPDDVADALASADRSRCGPVAPPDGLYLVRVDY